ncbi:hypothetical protein ERN12_16330 [Rhodobacteraceae bacterium]|nr:hypothetical protein ERN12_16330 [Paracoccaceae bacterium]
MTHNLLLGPDAQIRQSLQALRAFQGNGQIAAPRTDLHAGIFVNTDPEAAVAGRYIARRDGLISLSMQATSGTQARWQALHIPMGPALLGKELATIGTVIRARADTPNSIQLCVRSGQNEGFVDTFFSKSLQVTAEETTHLDIIELNTTPALPREAAWRDMIMFFPAGAVDIDILDMRFFIV